MIKKLQTQPAHTLDLLGPLVKSGEAVRLEAFCARHQRVCRLQTARRRIAGTVCVGFSRRGAGLSVADPTMIPTLAWCALRRSVQEPDVTQENVKGCPPELFKEYLFDLYYMDVLDLDAVQFGWACGRQRQFIRFRHRAKILAEISPCARFVKRFYRACAYSWKEHFFMSNWTDGILPQEAKAGRVVHRSAVAPLVASLVAVASWLSCRYRYRYRCCQVVTVLSDDGSWSGVDAGEDEDDDDSDDNGVIW